MFRFFEDVGLTPELLHESYQHQLQVLADEGEEPTEPADLVDGMAVIGEVAAALSAR